MRSLAALLLCASLGCAAPGTKQRPAQPRRVEQRALDDVWEELERQVLEGRAPRAGHFEGWTIRFDGLQEAVWVGTPAIPWREGLEVVAKVVRCRVEPRPNKVLVLIPEER